MLYTHSVNGITDIDFNVATQLDQLPVLYSPKWERENLQKNKTDESS